MPSWELFNKQSKEYQERILPESVSKRISLEMGISLGWERFVGPKGKVIAVDTFGASGTGADVMKLFGFTEENVVAQAKELLKA
jgi:transketolase